MNVVLLFLVVLGAIGVTAVAQRKGLQPALIIVLVGFAVSFIPGIPRLDIPSEIILGAVLPPLLYSAALNFSFFSFVRSFGPILGLGVGLVVVTAAAVGVIGNLLVPSLTLATAILLGAVVAPPDAVTAVAIGRKLGLPRRIMDVLTGESLVNDAAALTLFTITVAAIAGTHTLFASPVVLFLYAAIIGALIGLFLGVVTNVLRRYIKSAGLETVLGLMVPFAAYFIAEQLEASGVLAVVFAGFAVGTASVRVGYETRMQERQVWSSVDVLLEAFVFAYMGLQLRFVIDDVTGAGLSAPLVFLAGAGVLLTVMVIRPIWVYGMFLVDSLATRLHARKMEQIAEVLQGSGPRSDRLRARQAKVDELWARREERVGREKRGPKRREREPRQPMTRAEGIVVSWTGMRGVVTIAAASGIPLVTATGEDFPGRAVIQAIAFTVAVGTLLIQGATLPAVIRKVKLPDDSAQEKADAEKAAAIAQGATVAVVREFADNPPDGISTEMIEQVRSMAKRRVETVTALDAESRSKASASFDLLQQRMVSAQREALIDALQLGDVDVQAATTLISHLDYQEAAAVARQANRL